MTHFGSFGQEFTVSVKANQIAPGRKIYLEFINARGQAVKVDSLLPNAQKEVVFKGKVLDQGGFYLVNFYEIPNPQKVLLILEGGEKVQVQAEGINLPEKPGTFTVTGNTPNFTYMNQLLAISKSLENKVAAWNLEIEKTPASQDRIQKEFIKAQTETLEKIKALIPAMEPI